MPLANFLRWFQRGARPILGSEDPERTKRPYGSSSFGTWITDEFSLPAFRYDGCAPGSGCTEPADAYHQIGNGHVTAVAHVNGSVELFTAKTFYRYANRYQPNSKQFSGGFGWVRDGDAAWSTFFDDRPAGCTYERLFGVGYYKKTIEHGRVRVEQYIYAAPGGEEALLERLVVTNLSATETKSIQYFDYWDVAWWLVRCRDPMTSASAYDPARVKTSYDAARGALKVSSLEVAGDPDVPSLTNDPYPKTAFVAYLGDAPDRYDTVQDHFFGTGDRRLPGCVASGSLSNSLSDSGALANERATLVTEKRWTLAPGEMAELHLLYGIASRGAEDAVIDRYRSGPPNLLPKITEDWAARVPRLEVPQERWIEREMIWSTYYLLSGMMREDFFDARVFNQGSIYQYLWGANAGPRSALRHLIPIIYVEPDAARETLAYYLRSVSDRGELAYATGGYGAWHKMGFDPSDHALWLIWAVAEYINATRDFAFLDAEFDYYCETRRGACGRASAYDILKKAYEYQITHIGVGRNGLVKLKKWDWDDTLVPALGPYNARLTIEKGESTLNTALAVVAYPMLVAIAERRGDTVFAAGVREQSERLRTALRKQWRNDDHFNRAYVYDHFGQPAELGKDDLWLAANAVALVANNLLTEQQTTRLVQRMRRQLFEPSPLGLASQSAPKPSIGTPSFWYSLAGPAVEGLAKHNRIASARDLAWLAFCRQTLATHAQVYPNIWYGTWSGPDMYYTPLDAHVSPLDPDPGVGKTWCMELDLLLTKLRLCMRDFPVTNMFSHSEPLLGSVRMAGLWVDADGLTVDPVFPFDAFKWESRVFAVLRTPTEIQGRVTTMGDDTLQMRVRFDRGTSAKLEASVDGKPVPFSLDNTVGFVRFELPVRGGIATHWSVRKTV